MNKKYLAGLIVLIVVSCISCITSVQYLSKGCSWLDCAPERNFHVRDWEIPAQLLPEGSVIAHIRRPTDNSLGEIEAGFQTIHIEYYLAVYNIYRFPRQKDAINKFNGDKEDMVDSTTGAPWVTPKELQFASENADDVHIGCGYWSDIYRCKMIARYQEYYIFFITDINDQMTFVHFEKVLFYLDEQISSHLYP